MNNRIDKSLCGAILPAGKGTRLNSLTKNTPKSLIKVNGKAILDYQIDAYIKAGIKKI